MGPILDRFRCHLGAVLRVPVPPRHEMVFSLFSDIWDMAKSSKNHWFLMVFAISAEAVLATQSSPKLCQNVAKWVPKWLQKWSQNGVRNCLNMALDFWLLFGTKLGSKMDPKWLQTWTQKRLAKRAPVFDEKAAPTSTLTEWAGPVGEDLGRGK